MSFLEEGAKGNQSPNRRKLPGIVMSRELGAVKGSVWGCGPLAGFGSSALSDICGASFLERARGRGLQPWVGRVCCCQVDPRKPSLRR